MMDGNHDTTAREHHTMSSLPHPEDFYIAHRLYEGEAFHPHLTWGSLTDGPTEFDDLLCAIAESFGRPSTPYYVHMDLSLDTLRVWHFQGDVAPRDVTEDVVALVMGVGG